MTWLNPLLQPPYYLEIGHDFLRAQGASGGLELPLERLANGRIAPASKEKVLRSLQPFLKKKPWRPRHRVMCAISARGVTLRRLTLPAATKENLTKLVLLQIESEFPLSPEELAWGYRLESEMSATGNGQRASGAAPAATEKPGQQDLLVAAVKKEVVEEYSELLAACGASATFTLAALARVRLCPPQAGPYAILDVGANQSELMTLGQGIPISVRVLPWGSELLARSVEASLSLPLEQARRLTATPEAIRDELRGRQLRAAWAAALEPLSAAMNGSVKKLLLSGPGVCPEELAPVLAKQLGRGVECEPLARPTEAGSSTAILGLKQAGESMGAEPLLLLQVKPSNGGPRVRRAFAWESAWPALALAVALLGLPYAEALVLKPFLAHRLAALKLNKGRLLTIDRELGFLQFLKQNQSPYLDALFLLSKAAPPGAHIDSLAMNRHGELTLKISMREPTQVVDFRGKLIDSGFFSNVAIEEQAPSPDRQKLNIRLSAQWKAAGAPAVRPTPQEIEQARTNQNRAMPGAPPLPMPAPISVPAPFASSPGPDSPSNPPVPGARRSAVVPKSVKAPGNSVTNGGAK